MNPKVDSYFIDGCMRCPLGGTPECKVHNWDDELEKLREIVLATDLTEELKWKVPCYTYDGNNVSILSALKDKAVFSFFKGVLMKDPHNILKKPGPNSRYDRQIEFTDIAQVNELESVIKDYIAEAIEIEKQGLQVETNDDDLDYPAELVEKFDDDPVFKSAFEALTPGRQRGYVIHFSGAKQSSTRTRRIEKAIPQIFEGKGMYD